MLDREEQNLSIRERRILWQQQQCSAATTATTTPTATAILFIDDRQSEPYNKNQNFAERAWQDIQRRFNILLNWSGAPDECWLLTLKYIAFVTNHVALDRLDGRTSNEWIFSFTPDISVILQFPFYEPVYITTVENSSESDEELGRFVGYAEGIGHSMTHLVLTNGGKILARGRVRTAAKEGGFENFRALKEAENIRPQWPSQAITAPGAFSRKKEEHGESTPQDTHTCSKGKEACSKGQSDSTQQAEPKQVRFKSSNVEVETVSDQDEDGDPSDEEASPTNDSTFRDRRHEI